MSALLTAHRTKTVQPGSFAKQVTRFLFVRMLRAHPWEMSVGTMCAMTLVIVASAMRMKRVLKDSHVWTGSALMQLIFRGERLLESYLLLLSAWLLLAFLFTSL